MLLACTHKSARAPALSSKKSGPLCSPINLLDGELEPLSSNNTGKVFMLSQLLFVVGHVAVKHIVYLELVERE